MRRFVIAALIAAALPTSAWAQQTAPATPVAAPVPTAPAPAAPARRPSRWAGSQMSLQLAANGAFFNRSYVLSGDSTSTADMSFTFSPRYTINRQFQLRANWSFLYEFTNSDSTTTNHEPRFSDPTVDLWFRGIPPVGDFAFAVATGLAFPVSPESRANTLIATPRVIAQAAWGIEAFGGEFSVLTRATYQHPITQYTTPGVRGDRPYALTCFGSALTCSDQLRGGTNVHDQLGWFLLLSQTWGKFSPGLFFSMTHQWASAVPYVGGDAANVGARNSHLRQSTYFSGWLDYNPTPYMTLEVGYYMGRSVLDADGTYGNPIYAPYQDWRVYVSANIVLDKFIDAITGASAGGGGVIRAAAPTDRSTSRF
jgi:hypothetical protein